MLSPYACTPQVHSQLLDTLQIFYNSSLLQTDLREEFQGFNLLKEGVLVFDDFDSHKLSSLLTEAFDNLSKRALA